MQTLGLRIHHTHGRLLPFTADRREGKEERDEENKEAEKKRVLEKR